MPLLFMYDSAVKLSTIARVSGPLAFAYASDSACSLCRVTAPAMSITLTRSSISRTVVVVVASTMGSSPRPHHQPDPRSAPSGGTPASRSPSCPSAPLIAIPQLYGISHQSRDIPLRRTTYRRRRLGQVHRQLDHIPVRR